MQYVSEIAGLKMLYEWLKGEWSSEEYNPHRKDYEHLICNPDFDNPDHEKAILFLMKRREPLIGPNWWAAPWYIARLEEGDWENLLRIKECTWDAQFLGACKISTIASVIIKGNVLPPMALDLCGTEPVGDHMTKIRSIQKKIGSHVFQERLILVTTDLSGPFTILEGNHRAVAFELERLQNRRTDHIPTDILVGQVLACQCPWLNKPE